MEPLNNRLQNDIITAKQNYGYGFPLRAFKSIAINQN